jgi:hypothetical protein
MIKSALDQGAESVFAGVTAGTVTTIVTKGNGISQSDVQAQWPSDGRGHLGHLKSVRQPSSLMIVGEDEYLGFASEATKGGRMQNSISVAFKTGSPFIRFFWMNSLSGTPGSSC